MEASLKFVRTVRAAMLVILLLQVFAAERLQHSQQPTNLVFYCAITSMAVAGIVATFVLRRFMVLRSEETLARQPDDPPALNRWRAGYVVVYALCEAVALYGIVLRVVGFSLAQVIPFYAAGFGLMLFFAPRRPSNTIG